MIMTMPIAATATRKPKKTWTRSDHSDDAGGGARETNSDPVSVSAEVDALILRSQRTIGAYNDMASQAGRGELQLADPEYDEAGRLAEWLRVFNAQADAPAVLAAAIALDAWLSLQPSQRQGEAGFLLAATVLRQREIASLHLPALALGLRHRHYRWHSGRAIEIRLAGLLDAIAGGAHLGHADLDRLTNARGDDEAMRGKIEELAPQRTGRPVRLKSACHNSDGRSGAEGFAPRDRCDAC